MSRYLITGANRGIGLELTRQILAQGHQVVATCRNPGEAGELNTLTNAGELQVVQCDISKPDDIAALVESLHGSTIDVLINLSLIHI